MFSDNPIWQQVQQYLPEENRISTVLYPEEKTVIYKDISIRYDEYLPDRKSRGTVVILHGVGGNGRLLSFIAVPLLRAGYKVICPDLPGYGYTKSPGSFDYSTWIDVASFLVEREIISDSNVFVFGLSAGGMLAFNVCCKVKKVKGLIVTNILDNRLQVVRDYSAKNKFHSRVGIKILQLLPGFLKHIPVPVKTVANMKAIVNSSSVLKLLLRDKVGSGSSVSLSFLLSMMNSIPLLEPEAYDICPVLLLHPALDKWTPVEISRFFFDKINSPKKVFMLDNAGHFPIESPGLQQLGERSIEFLSNPIAFCS